jgi:hypothetical protein
MRDDSEQPSFKAPHAEYLQERYADAEAIGQCAYCAAPAWLKANGQRARLCRDHLDQDSARGKPRLRPRHRQGEPMTAAPEFDAALLARELEQALAERDALVRHLRALLKHQASEWMPHEQQRERWAAIEMLEKVGRRA